MFGIKGIGRRHPGISLAQCQAIARKFDSVDAWKTGHPQTYRRAYAKGWLAMCTQHMRTGE
ncbi:hypothetical protein LJ739_15990 [Aestuariibacter halophilus]|uniref:Uncharacterized protein n=1 Tax=Fluctibacter halophilus TaxID=226011 RepID=A0ABS8GD88_9ALTE|nr:hypothetical protein [Aestuariibacter halophilus]MCC2617754.1 hypothetical protein [Aestuariibacter halophilus]